jgi:AraC-like DNA-binding protein
MKEIHRITNKVLNQSGIFIDERILYNDVDTHWHEFYEIEYILSGSGKVYINDKVYDLLPNTLLFLSPVDFEKIQVEEPISVINLAFSNEIISSKVISLLPLGSVIYNYSDTILRLLLDEAVINDQWFYNKYMRLVNCILIDVVRDFSKSNEAMENSPVLKAINYMHLYFKTPITLEQISNHVGLAPTYFSSIFTKKMKTSFKAYLSSLRLNYAANLLIISDLSTTEICYASGFNDFSNFSRAFKQKFSVSPTKYRTSSK